MGGQNIGRAVPQRNVIGEIAEGFAKRSMELEDEERKIAQEEETYNKRNPVAMLQNLIVKKHNEQGYDALSPKEKAFIDKSGYGIDPKDNTPYGQSGVSQLSRNKILGTLQSGYFVNPLTGVKQPLETAEEASNYIKSSGYQNFEQDPEIMQVLQNYSVPETITEPKQEDEGFMTGVSKFFQDLGFKDKASKYSQEDLEHTAKTHGITVEEVIKQLEG